MNITRHNYEEYFILYMDNELAAADRRAVEEFISLHPDLKEELELMMQFKLQPDTSLVFAGKEDLWKEKNMIHAGNQTEWLLLYMDNELTPGQVEQLQAYLGKHPAARLEWEILQKTRVSPEQVPFPGKESLYRREVRKIPVIWFRVAAALVIAALGLTVLLLVNRNNNSVPGSGTIAGNKNAVDKTVVPDNKQLTEPREDKDPVAMQNNKQEQNDSGIKEKQPQPKMEMAINNDRDPKIIRQPLPEKIKEQPLAKVEEKRDNHLPVPERETRVKYEEKALANVELNPEIRNPALGNNTMPVTNTIVPTSDYKTAALTTSENNFDEEDGGKKNRHRGIFRKIARTFEKRTNVDATEDNKLLVAGFAINLK